VTLGNLLFAVIESLITVTKISHICHFFIRSFLSFRFICADLEDEAMFHNADTVPSQEGI